MKFAQVDHYTNMWHTKKTQNKAKQKTTRVLNSPCLSPNSVTYLFNEDIPARLYLQSIITINFNSLTIKTPFLVRLNNFTNYFKLLVFKD